MNRRHFLGMLAGAALLPRPSANAQDVATPAATPQHSGRPRPIVLGDGIELIDYRIYPSEGVRRIIGEIWSTREEMVDSPVISMTFPDVEEMGGFAYAPPVTPVLRPGESTMIFGVLPDKIDSEDKLATGEFGLCSPVVQGEHTDLYAGLRLSVSRDVLDFRETALNVQGEVRNDGNTRAAFTNVRGFIRDRNGRYAGCTTTVNTGHIVPGGTRKYSLWAGTTVKILANPFVLLNDDIAYSVDIVPGLVDTLTAPGCSSGYPWD